MILISSILLGHFPLPKERWFSHSVTLEADEIVHVENECEHYFAKCWVPLHFNLNYFLLYQ